jgi:hypothetical protein
LVFLTGQSKRVAITDSESHLEIGAFFAPMKLQTRGLTIDNK